MIQCETCDEWFHAVCISSSRRTGVRMKQLSAGVYECPGCALLAGKFYAFAWACDCEGGNLLQAKKTKAVAVPVAVLDSKPALVPMEVSQEQG
jgi:hypothetical protein